MIQLVQKPCGELAYLDYRPKIRPYVTPNVGIAGNANHLVVRDEFDGCVRLAAESRQWFDPLIAEGNPTTTFQRLSVHVLLQRR